MASEDLGDRALHVLADWFADDRIRHDDSGYRHSPLSSGSSGRSRSDNLS
jgi:hypothetical protein